MNHSTTNVVEVRCVGLQRSGHHAIINWIISNIDGRYCFLNDCQPQRNPLDERILRQNPGRKIVTNIPEFDIAAESSGVHASKDYLIYNYEDRELDKVESDYFYAHHDQWVGASGAIYNLLILRDPFNNIASKLRMEDNRRSLRKVPSSVRHLSRFDVLRLVKNPRRLIQKVLKRLKGKERKDEKSLEIVMRSRELFKEYAREYLGDTEVLSNKITVNYNRWFVESEYRAELGRLLGMKTSHKGLDRVAGWGGGSSFEHTDADGAAPEMKVLERWKAVVDDERYRELVRDPELHELSERIFGTILSPEWDIRLS